MKIQSPARRKNWKFKGLKDNNGGYVLLTLMLMVSLLILAAAAVAPSIAFEIKRDREEELIHRGVQYSRAIRAYFKKFGRYPAKLEDLESTNNLRFLRKRYKDPVTGQDFKILHFGEVKMAFGSPLAGAVNLNGAAQPNGNSVFGQQQPGGGFGGQVAFGTGGPAVFGAAGTAGSSPGSPGYAAQNQPADSNTGSSSSSSSSSSASSSSTTPQQGQPGDASSGDTPSGLSGPTFGGMPIVGVVSTSKKEGFREFNHKKKYSEWQFIYDPGTDRGGLLMTPNQPTLQGFANQQLQPGQQGGTTNSPLGTSPSGFGSNSSGFGNNNNPTSPQNPPSNPQNPQ